MIPSSRILRCLIDLQTINGSITGTDQLSPVEISLAELSTSAP